MLRVRQPRATTLPLPLPRPRTRFVAPQLSQRAIIWIAGALLLVTAALNLYVSQISVVATSAYELQNLQQERYQWRARNQQLQLELSKAHSLRWIEYQAIQRLGMTPSGDVTYVRVDGLQRQALPSARSSSGN